MVAGPDRVRHFARALGVRAKTDRVDAAVLAHSAERGRPDVRPGLDRAAMSGVRGHPTLRTFSTRVVDAGNPKQAALTAVAHTLLTMLNPRARAGTSWAPPPSAPA